MPKIAASQVIPMTQDAPWGMIPPVCPGYSDRQIPQRDTRRFARSKAARLSPTRGGHPRKTGQGQKTERDREGAIAVACSNGRCVGVTPSGDDLGTHWGEQGRADRGTGRSTRQPSLHRLRTESHRGSAQRVKISRRRDRMLERLMGPEESLEESPAMGPMERPHFQSRATGFCASRPHRADRSFPSIPRPYLVPASGHVYPRR